MPESDLDSVIPARLGFLAIYNPTLGPTDETLEDQIVFYTSSHSPHADNAGENEDAAPEGDKNERLRQIGLAQGMVNFASNFSAGKPLEYVETEKARIVLLELEKDWWVVASIDLTRLPADQTSSESSETPTFQYSSREMGPPSLYLQQLRRAHSIFLLHHDFSLKELYDRVGRAAFCLYLERFWEKFTWNWELLLTGNPIVEIYNAIKLSAGGELGVGVGEEEWGSGEREVLEDFVSRTDGLVDLIVSRFGDPSRQVEDEGPWLGSDTGPRLTDGVLFSGVGSLSRPSVANLSHWMEWIYRFGDAAYGVGRDPSSLRRRKPRKPRGRASSRDLQGAQPSTPDRNFRPGIPRPLVLAAPQPIQDEANTSGESPKGDDQSGGFGTETVMKYLSLGYGSAWSFGSRSASTPPRSSATVDHSPASPTKQTPDHGSPQATNPQNSMRNIALGRFVLGPRDDLETLDDLEEGSPRSEEESSKPKTRIVHRTLHVRRVGEAEGETQEVQAVIYVNQPFMFTFLFNPETPSLNSPSLYTTIHHQLGPLQKPLLASTSPATAASRISQSENISDPTKRFSTRSQPVYDLVYDPSNLTIRSSIPNIPNLGTSTNPSQAPKSPPSRRSSPSPSPSGLPPPLSRVESLAIHHRLLSTYTDTRSRTQELERTCKTSRGWWVVWVRLSPSDPAANPASALPSIPSSAAISTITTEDNHGTFSPSPSASLYPFSSQPLEAFIIRKASDYVSPSSQTRVSSGARFFRDLGGASASSSLTGSTRAADTAPATLAEGLGMDARRYIEGLLSLNR
ncbi:hypothetical protein N7510_002252 [Penicillium lagena]|uniref:uncharacterized protein n=1 Tax=Penicillium lagena TaxID=94218 RepID=UPI0025424CE5|nr:uncharacterized protein N7510_002252 [Penicillium lagena]KAJ5625943.1 hypothetical protein N7510_002252 [Penicillium lagena]